MLDVRQKMNPIQLAFLFAISWLLSACHPNTGHTLSTDDPLEIPSKQDWKVTWTISAPKAGVDNLKRLVDPKWNYSLDGGAWQSVTLQVTRMTDTELQLTAIIPKSEFNGNTLIHCYITYVFDGTQEGRDRIKDSRTIKIRNNG